MSRTLILLVLVLSTVGCGNNSTDGQPGKSANGKDGAPGQAGQPGGTSQPGTDGSAVTMQMPKDDKTGTTTLGEASQKAGLKPYPGSEKASGDLFKRGDGGFKDDITFSTPDSVQKVNDFYKAQGLDAKAGPVGGSAMGPTKGGANIIVMFERKGDKTEVSFKSVRYDKK